MIIGSRQRVAALEGNVTLHLNYAELQQVNSLILVLILTNI